MKLSVFCTLSVIAISFCNVLPAYSETMYVSDQLVITLRRGKSSQHKILDTLKTGSKLEVLEKDETYAQVRTDKDEVGYVKVQYLTKETPKTIMISRLERERDNLKKKLASLKDVESRMTAELKLIRQNHKDEIKALSGDKSSIDKVLLNTKSELEDVNLRFEALVEKSKNVVVISEDRDRLRKENIRLNSEMQLLSQENKKLMRSGMIQWFLAGGGVFFMGWIIGKISRKKRSRF